MNYLQTNKLQRAIGTSMTPEDTTPVLLLCTNHGLHPRPGPVAINRAGHLGKVYRNQRSGPITGYEHFIASFAL
ncbi:unnamed protein product [Penicillium roqueforti FM164]|uniref:Uncharacterized protein n=1 Tax=Penicillium roqueforti (strain FM164) TaxID=1365484 RepID=W6QR35_PENRF|nr:unnamed protein product [Penicillium roqueforti FM164]